MLIMPIFAENIGYTANTICPIYSAPRNSTNSVISPSPHIVKISIFRLQNIYFLISKYPLSRLQNYFRNVVCLSRPLPKCNSGVDIKFASVSGHSHHSCWKIATKIEEKLQFYSQVPWEPKLCQRRNCPRITRFTIITRLV